MSFIKTGAGRPEKGQKEHRRDHAVGTVLSHRLDGRPGDPCLIQPGGVPADDHGDGRPCLLHIALFQGVAYLHAGIFKGPGRQCQPGQKAFDDQAGREMQSVTEKKKDRRQGRGYGHGQQDQKQACGQLAFLTFGKKLSKALFQMADQIPDQADGVPGTVWIPQDQVQDESRSKNHSNSHRASKDVISDRSPRPSAQSSISVTALKPLPFWACQVK